MSDERRTGSDEARHCVSRNSRYPSPFFELYLSFGLSLFAAVAGLAPAQAAESEALLAAVKAGRAVDADTVISDLLAAGATANTADADGTSALHWAVHHRQPEWARALIAAGAAVDAPNRYGVRPAYLAAENGDGATMQLLIEAGADPDAEFAEGEMLLMTAARTGDVDTLRVLLAAGADVNATERRGGQTALMWAAAADNAAAVTELLQAGAERDARELTDNFTALAFAIRAGAIAAARALLDAGADANGALADGTSLLLLATTNAKFAAADLLLAFGADPNATAGGRTALHEIARVRRWNRGFNLPGPEHNDNFSSLELVRSLLASGADIDAAEIVPARAPDGEPTRGPTPFLAATRTLDLPYMQLLLDLGADPTIATDEGTTAVMVAAGVGQGLGSAGAAPGSVEEALAALELTLSVGAGTVDDFDSRNETPLHGAMYRGGSVALIDFLVNRGASLELRVNSRGWTPLRIADGIAIDGIAFIRYPEAAARLREHMRAQGLPVPEIEWDGPADTQP